MFIVVRAHMVQMIYLAKEECYSDNLTNLLLRLYDSTIYTTQFTPYDLREPQ